MFYCFGKIIDNRDGENPMIGQVDYVVFVASFVVYTLAIIGVGLYSSRFSKANHEDYFLAGRSLGKWVAALSASASSESGWVTLGLVGMAFTHGVRAYWILPGCLLGFIFNWFFIAGRMRDRAGELSALTLPDFFSLHFKERVPVLRLLTVAVILAAMLLYVAAQFAAAGKAFSAAFPERIEYREGVLIGAAVVLLYTVTGGFRAVCWTDFLQALLMVIALVVFPLFLLVKEGGYSYVLDHLRAADPTLLQFTPQESNWALLGFLLGSGALGINFGYPGQPHVLVRFMALKNRHEAKIAGVVAVAWGAMVYWGAVTVGLLARAMTEAGAAWGEPLRASKDASEQCLVLAAANLLPAVVAGVVLAAVLSAICSTADSQLVVAASAAANDLWARVIAKKNIAGNNLLLDRCVVFVLGISAVLLVIDKDVQVYEYVLTYGWAILGAAFGPQVILLLWWKRASYLGCVAGMIVGGILPVIWLHWYEAVEREVAIYNLPIGFVASMVVNVVVSLACREKVLVGEK